MTSMCEQLQSKNRFDWYIFPVWPDFGLFHLFHSSICNFAFSISKPTFLLLSASSAVCGLSVLCFYNKHLFSYYVCFVCLYNYPKCISSLFIKFFSYFIGKNNIFKYFPPMWLQSGRHLHAICYNADVRRISSPFIKCSKCCCGSGHKSAIAQILQIGEWISCSLVQPTVHLENPSCRADRHKSAAVRIFRMKSGMRQVIRSPGRLSHRLSPKLLILENHIQSLFRVF